MQRRANASANRTRLRATNFSAMAQIPSWADSYIAEQWRKFGREVERRRLAIGWTQETAAQKIGKQRQAWQRMALHKNPLNQEGFCATEISAQKVGTMPNSNID